MSKPRKAREFRVWVGAALNRFGQVISHRAYVESGTAKDIAEMMARQHAALWAHPYEPFVGVGVVVEVITPKKRKPKR